MQFERPMTTSRDRIPTPKQRGSSSEHAVLTKLNDNGQQAVVGYQMKATFKRSEVRATIKPAPVVELVMID